MAAKLILLCSILISTIIGNLFVIVVVYRSRRSQWTTNHFVFNLAIVNLVTPTMYLSFTIDWLYHSRWALGSFACKITGFLGHFNMFVSVGVMCCMSFDRFYVTAYPLTFKFSKTLTRKLLVCIWIASAITCSPILHFYNTNIDDNCLPDFSTSWIVFIFLFYLMISIPHVVTYVMYMNVYLCIITRNKKSTANKVPRTKIKVTKLLVTQVIMHTILWLPFIVFLLISSLSSYAQRNCTGHTVTLYIFYTASAASPLIYVIFSGDFRRGCKQILVKYDASNAYRVPGHILERKNRIDVLTPEFNSGCINARLSLTIKRESTEQTNGVIISFEQPRQAWS